MSGAAAEAKDDKERAAGPSQVGVYTVGHRRLEIAAILAHIALSVYLAMRISGELAAGGKGWWALGAALLGYMAADFVSGWVHWLADNYGTEHTPIVGPTFVRTFREHHLDQKAITRHDFIETNGDSCVVSAPVLALVAIFVPAMPGVGWAVGIHTFALAMCLGVLLTTQSHKWSHMENPPLVARVLQSMRLVINPKHHAKHHRGKHDTHYCITTGWLNPVLQTLCFWSGMKKLFLLFGLKQTS